MNIIFTIDFDAFYASCEESRNPELKKYPIAIANRIDGIRARGIISTANYEARKYGVKSGMPVFKALKLTDKIKFIDPDSAFYQEMSEKIFSLIKKFSTKIQISSIDECFLDVTDVLKKHKVTPIRLAKYMQDVIMKATKIGVSIGISTNLLLAKMASGIKKPLGIYEIYPHEIQEKLWPLPIKKLHGLGKRTIPFYHDLNINTIGDLAKLKHDPIKALEVKSKIGKRIYELIDLAWGISSDEVDNTFHDLKSISHGKSFAHTLDEEEILFESKRLLKTLVRKMHERQIAAKSIFIKYKNEKKQLFTRQNTLNEYENNYNQLSSKLTALIYESNLSEQKVRHLTIGFSHLKEIQNINTQIKFDDFLNASGFEVKNNESKKEQELIKKTNFYFSKDILVDLKTLNDKKKYNAKLLENDSVKFKVWD